MFTKKASRFHCTCFIAKYVQYIDGKLLQRPIVDKDLCIGCGICQTKCPLRPKRAIIVTPIETQLD